MRAGASFTPSSPGAAAAQEQGHARADLVAEVAHPAGARGVLGDLRRVRVVADVERARRLRAAVVDRLAALAARGLHRGIDVAPPAPRDGLALEAETTARQGEVA